MDLNKIVKELCDEDWTNNINIEFDNLYNMNGICYFKKDNDKRYVNIYIDEKLKDMTVSCHATVWHELCHAEPWILYGHTDKHSKEWYKRLFRKPFLAIWNLTIEKILTAHVS